MSYIIEYCPQKRDRYPARIERANKIPTSVLVLAVMVCLILVLQLDVAGARTSWFQALNDLAEHIRSGTGIGQSIVDCLQELNG